MSYKKLPYALYLAIAAAAVTGWTSCAGKKTSTVPAASSAITAVASAVPVVNGSFVVEPRTFKDFKLVVPTGIRNARVEGTFSASGARNDIEVMLLDEHEFQNWRNRHKFTATYDSGRVTAGKINVALPADPATYVIVFSNRFSFISNKAVVADLKLRYDGAK